MTKEENTCCLKETMSHSEKKEEKKKRYLWHLQILFDSSVSVKSTQTHGRKNKQTSVLEGFPCIKKDSLHRLFIVVFIHFGSESQSVQFVHSYIDGEKVIVNTKRERKQPISFRNRLRSSNETSDF